MVLTDEDIQDFIESWKQDFGEVLTADRARSEIQRLLDFFTILGEEGGAGRPEEATVTRP